MVMMSAWHEECPNCDQTVMSFSESLDGGTTELQSMDCTQLARDQVCTAVALAKSTEHAVRNPKSDAGESLACPAAESDPHPQTEVILTNRNPNTHSPHPYPAVPTLTNEKKTMS